MPFTGRLQPAQACQISVWGTSSPASDQPRRFVYCLCVEVRMLDGLCPAAPLVEVGEWLVCVCVCATWMRTAPMRTKSQSSLPRADAGSMTYGFADPLSKARVLPDAQQVPDWLGHCIQS